jgi:translation initiation factor IF-2
MGHVDHGKTSLLDYIRKASIAEREHGGITQHIGAYSVTLEDGRKVAFIDTPGHAAFTAMRARGAKVTDIVVLVVAADDGVMPQTIEALNHAKAAGVTIVVALNKIDKPAANPDKVKQQLSEYGLQPEEWGGDTMFYPVSALTGAGIPELLEGLALVSELAELKANPECRAVGTVLEARQEKGRGTVATILVQAGTLKVGDIFVSGAEYGRVRSLLDHNAKPLTEATPSMPVEITGFNGVPVAGDDFIVVVEEAKARQVSEARQELKLRQESLALAGGPISLEEFARMAREKEILDLNVIVKADVHGSLEAVRESIIKLSGEKVKVKVLHGAVGGVNESDVQLALASKALILGFGVRGEPRALAEAEANGVEVRFYRVIYELIDDVKNAMTGLLAPIKKEKRLGRVEVRNTFTVPKVGTVAGCYIQDGLARRNSYIRLLRDSRVIHEGKMSSLRRFKDDVKEVQTGYECGISIEGFNDIQTGDNMEIYEFEEIAATLD